MTSPPTPTMADVAQLAGVSHQTVSRVLNDSPLVRADTRGRVQAAIAQLGYRRNSAARALVTRRSGMIGVVVDELHLYGPASTVIGIAAAARDAGYGITLDPLWVVTGSTLAAAFEHQLDQSAEAIILVAGHGETPEEEMVHRIGIPVIALDGFLGPDNSTVGVDHRAGGTMATSHLLDLGHRVIAHVRGPQDWVQARERQAGYADAMESMGLQPGPILDGDWSPAAGYAAGLEIVAAHPHVTGVFVANDQMAIGVIRALAESGVRVGQDVSVVGFDDIPEAEYSQPPLTSVRQDFGALGREAVGIAIATIRGEQAPSVLIRPALVARDSTGAPAASAAITNR